MKQFLHLKPVIWLLLSSMLFICPVSSSIAVEQSSVSQLQTGLFIQSGAEHPSELPHSGWKARSIPDHWNITMPDEGGVGWYRFEFDLPEADHQLWALYIPGVSMTADAYLNGYMIGSGGVINGDQIARNWFRPLMFSFSGSMLLQGVNTLDLRVAAHANDGGGLRRAQVGHFDDLKAEYSRLWLFRALPGYIMVTLMFGLTFVVSALVILRPKDVGYLWFASASFFGGVFSVNYIWTEVPIPWHYWECLVQTSIGIFTYSLMRFLHYILKVNRPRLELICTIYFPIGGLLFILVPSHQLIEYYQYWHIASPLLAGYMVATSISHWRQHGSWDALIMAMGITLATLLGCYDWVLVQFDLQHQYPFLFQFAPSAMLLTASWLWLSSLVRALSQYEQINEDLNFLVEEKSRDLRHALNAVKRESASKSHYFAAASHDLRQPLHSMELFLFGLKRYMQGDEQQHVFSRVQESLNTLRSMFDQLLDISRFDAGDVKAEETDFLLKPVMMKIAEEFQPICLEKGLQFRVRSQNFTLFSDPLLVSRVLRNYISNAIRSTHSGGVLFACRKRGNLVRIEVRDTGKGIARENLDTIFEAFHQLDNPERNRSKGVGLGLSIVKQISLLLNIPIHVSSIPQKGSVFSVDVRQGDSALVDLRQDSEMNLCITTRVSPLNDLHIWMIDDDPTVLEAMELLFEQLGGVCHSFTSSNALFEFMELESHQIVMPKLFIADYRMPGNYNGLELGRRLREKLNCELPIILITGDIEVEGVEMARASVLYKPLKGEVLQSEVKKMLAL